MTIEVEDGTGKANAESYASVADADAYCTAYGYTEWTGTDTEKEVALRKGTRYVDSTYDFTGEKKTAEQALQWPRDDATLNGFDLDNDEIPAAVVNASIEAARISMGTDMTPNVDHGGLVKREKVDVIEVEYQDGAPGGTRFSIIDLMLRGLISVATGTSVITLQRA